MNKKKGYEKGMSREQESQANRYAVKCHFTALLILTVVWVLNLLHIFIIDSRLMNTGYLLAVGTFVLSLAIIGIFGTDKSWIKYAVLGCIVLLATVLGIFLTYQAVLVCVLPLCCSLQYNRKKVVYYTYAVTVVGVFLSSILGYYYGLCDANMLTLTSGPLTEYVDYATQTLTFSTINQSPILTISLYYALPRCMILFAFITIISHVSENAAKRAVREKELKILSEVDGMTNLYNRNKYLSMLHNYYPKVEQLGVVFWDVDGLKELNDREGHERGDSMLVSVASSIVEFCGEKRRAYRIGGDEFVLIMEDVTEEQVHGIVISWQMRMREINKESGVNFTASVGYAVGKGSEIEEVIRHADKMMYEDKMKKHVQRG